MKNIQKRFGAIAVEKGFITTDQLTEALSIQARENTEKGVHRLLGQILMDLGYMREAQVEEVVDTLSHAVIYALGSGR